MIDNLFKMLTCFFNGLLMFLTFSILLIGSPDAEELIRVGIYDNPPKVFNTSDGFTTGLYPEILNSIAKEREWTIQYIPGTWKECLERLEKKQIDIVVDIAKTNEREKLFDFTEEAVFTNWGAVYAQKYSSIVSFKDMKNKSVAIVKESVHSYGPNGFKHLMKLFNIPCNFVEVDSNRQALLLLDSAQVDACVVNRLFGTLYSDNYEVEATPIIFSPHVLLFAGQKNTERGKRLLRQIDESLRRLKENPDSLYHKAMGYYLSGGQGKWFHMQRQHLSDLNLTKQETIWLKEHPVIKIGIDPNFAPYEFLSENNEFKGISADYLELLTQKTGLKFELVQYDSWVKTVNAIKNREIDVLPCVGVSKERQEFLTFTNPYIQFPRVIITDIASSIETRTGLKALTGFAVGVQQDSSHHAFINEESTITPQLYNTFQEALMALSKKEIDAVVGNLTVATHLISELSLANLKFAGYADPDPQLLSAGVRKDWPELHSILNRAFELLSYREKSHILSKWFPLPTVANNDIGLTREEQEWLLMNPRIRVAWDREWAPIEFANSKGQPHGISMDYLFAIEKMLGVTFDMGQDVGWQETSARVERREIDMFSCVAVTPKRLKYLKFTDAYLTVPVVIFGGKDAHYVSNMSDLYNKKIAVIAGYATDEWVSNDYPEFDIVRPITINDAFDLLKQKKIDAFIGNILPGNYYLSRLQDHNIKIIGETPYKHKQRMAVRKDWPHFTRILQKAIYALPEAEKTYYYRKWAWIKYNTGFNYTLFKKILLIISVIIAGILLWNRLMAAEITRRKKIEAKLSLSESELRESNIALRKVEKLKDNLANMIAHDMRSPLMGISSMLQILNNRLQPLKLEDIVKDYLQTARNGVDTLSRMIQSFLDVFKLESNELLLNYETLDFHEVTQNTVNDMQPQANMYKQHLTQTGKSVMGKFDPEIIRRILTNLIENALKASPKDGTVNVHISCDKMNLIAEVTDTGQGIPFEFQEHIFDKFICVEANGSKHIPSYGLGLAFCKLAIEAHKGKIALKSKIGFGSSFRIMIPKKP